MNLTPTFKKQLCYLLFLCFVGKLAAQDLHYSMFNRSPMNLSPALVGVFGGDWRFTGSYRSQWSSVPVDYQTFTGTVEHKFFPKKPRNSYFSAGFGFNHDDAGDLSLGLNQVALSGSYLHSFTPKHYLSVGIQSSGADRSFNANRIRTDLQYSDGFDKNRPHGEEHLVGNDNIGKEGIFDLSGGINYRFQNTDNDKRTRLDLGAAVYHIVTNDKTFEDGVKKRLDPRLSLYGITSFKILPLVDLGLLASGQFQGPHDELVVGGNGRFYLENKKGTPMSLLFGLSYRVGDALIPNINFDYSNFSFGFSYDINVSEFDIATSNRGGPEFSIIYTFANVRPLAEHKVCPIF